MSFCKIFSAQNNLQAISFLMGIGIFWFHQNLGPWQPFKDSTPHCSLSQTQVPLSTPGHLWCSLVDLKVDLEICVIFGWPTQPPNSPHLPFFANTSQLRVRECQMIVSWSVEAQLKFSWNSAEVQLELNWPTDNHLTFPNPYMTLKKFQQK